MNKNYANIFFISLLSLTSGFILEAQASPSKKPAKKVAAPTKQPPANTSNNPFNSPNFEKEPTFIKADSLVLKSEERYFIYSGNVEVKQADLTLTANTLEGHYDENNKINNMLAKNNVVILKGPSIKGTGNQAAYEASTDILTLTDNPEITQNGSTLNAELIKIYLKENRSEASGQVRVKMLSSSDTPKLLK